MRNIRKGMHISRDESINFAREKSPREMNVFFNGEGRIDVLRVDMKC